MITAIIVGAGHRAMTYAAYAKAHPDKLKIVGVADPNELRRKMVSKEYGLTPDQCFNSAEELAAKGKIADAVINGTMDRQHVPTTLPLLKAGYDVLLEKPFAISEEEARELHAAAQKYNCRIMICHVLRYAPFYCEIKQLVLAGEIGRIINIQTAEHVSYHHVASCFVRGKWHRKDICGSSALMAKCCHDLDLLAWFMSGINPVKVASFGGLHYFCRKNAPADSGEYCLLDCPIEKDCLYSARKHCLDHPDRWAFYVWAELEHIDNPTLQQKEEFLKRKDNPYSRCVWKLDNNVVDRQSVMVEFADGVTATHNMVCGTSRPMRKIHIIGSHGEIQGIMDDSKFTVRHIDLRPGHEYSENEIDLNIHGDTTGALDNRFAGFLEDVELQKQHGVFVFAKIGGLYCRGQFVRGEEDLLMDLMLEKSFCNDFFDLMAEHLTQMALETLKRGNLWDTGLLICDDMASSKMPNFSPDIFEEFFLPRYKKMLSAVRNAGCSRVFFHSDGNIGPLLDLLIEAGFEGFNPLEPSCGLDLIKLREKYGRKIVFCGGVCNKYILPKGILEMRDLQCQ